MVYFLRKVVSIVPQFTVDRFLEESRAVRERIETGGVFVAHGTRFLIGAGRPHDRLRPGPCPHHRTRAAAGCGRP